MESVTFLHSFCSASFFVSQDCSTKSQDSTVLWLAGSTVVWLSWTRCVYESLWPDLTLTQKTRVDLYVHGFISQARQRTTCFDLGDKTSNSFSEKIMICFSMDHLTFLSTCSLIDVVYLWNVAQTKKSVKNCYIAVKSLWSVCELPGLVGET